VLRAISEYYRIPKGMITLCRNPSPQGEPGFFKFDGILCFGQCAAPVLQTAAGHLHECGGNGRGVAGALNLDFDPDELAENFRRERYTSAKRRSMLPNVLRRGARAAYYGLRPILPVAVRKHIQRAHASGWRNLAFPRWPLDTSLDLLFERLLLLAMESAGIERVPFIWFWPEGHRAAAILTHDVESTAGRDFCSRLMDLNESYGLSASFQVVPEQRYSVPEAYLDEIRERGSEVNIHDLNHDGSLFSEKDEFVRRAAKINDYGRRFGALGFRSAVLYRNLEWLGALDFVYDMSVPNSAPLDPQRGGCCTVMPYFIDGLVELPLTTIQDYSLFHLLGTYEMEVWERQITSVISHYGLLSFLIHPDYIIESSAQDAYCRLLERLRGSAVQHNCWLPLPREVAHWWKQRHEMKLVKSSEGWEVHGNGAERARVAWAMAHRGQVIYSLDGDSDAFPSVQ
jgi:hypothetical protein